MNLQELAGTRGIKPLPGGLEPPIPGLESGMLPLHHAPEQAC